MGFQFTKIQNSKLVNKQLLHQLECVACPLSLLPNKHKDIKPHGPGPVYVLGMGPGQEEDEAGEFFVGRSGIFLKECLTTNQIKQIRFSNITRTREPSNRPPPEAVECCRPSVERDIAITKPKVIIGLGGDALNWALHTENESIMAWRGHRFPVSIDGHICWFFPVFHPSYILRENSESGGGYLAHIFKLDLQRAFTLFNDNITPHIEDPSSIHKKVIPLFQLDKIRYYLNELRNGSLVAIDLETSGKDPYKSNARIFSMAIGNEDFSIAFPWRHPGFKWSTSDFLQLKKVIKEFLHSLIRKVAHNLAFELEWLVKIYDKHIVRSSWDDSMVAAFCLGFGGRSKSGQKDETFTGLLSLHKQCICYFGLPLKDFSRVNRDNLANEHIQDILVYNGADAISTARLFNLQLRDLEKEQLLSVYKEQVRRVPATVLMQSIGLPVDLVCAKKLLDQWTDTTISISNKIFSDPDVIKYKSRSVFSPTSSPNIINFFSSLGFGMSKKTKTGVVQSADDDILPKIDHPVAKLIQKLRTENKIKSTYLEPFLDKTSSIVYQDGKIRPHYTTVFTATSRFSCRSPNIQNFPSSHVVRSIIVSPAGHKLVELDYGQIEFRCFPMETKDPKLIEYVVGNKDIHKEWAVKIARRYPQLVGCRSESEVLDLFATNPEKLKALRQTTKSEWVFAGFFGASAAKMSHGMSIPISIGQQLYNEFWREFSIVKKWQNEKIEFYKARGYIETLSGRKIYGFLDRGQIINYPIQSVAFDIVADAMSRLVEYAEQTEQWQFVPVKSIHDDLSFFLPEASIKKDLAFIIKAMLTSPLEFINVPLSVEVSIGDTWYNKQPCGVYSSDNIDHVEHMVL